MSEGKSFFTTVPGILTGLAALITAITGMMFALSELGFWDSTPVPAPLSGGSQQQAQTTDGWAIIGKYKSGRFYDLKLMVHSDAPAIGKRYDVADGFRLVQKRLNPGENQGQVITLGKVQRGDSVELIDIYVRSPSSDSVPVWAKLRAELENP